MASTAVVDAAPADHADLHESMPAFLRRLRTGSDGLSSREAARRLQVQGRNELPDPIRRSWALAMLAQLVHPLALVLWGAALLSVVAGTRALALAIVLVIVLNAAFSFAQERQAQRAVAALAQLLPRSASVVRDGLRQVVDATELVVGDVIVVEEGDRVSADARLLDGALDIDMSAITGESSPVTRSPVSASTAGSDWLNSQDLVFSGTMCTTGIAQAVVFATGARTELGRIAALSQHQHRDPSPLERQVRWVAWLIAFIGVAVGAAFMPLGVVAGLSVRNAFLFAVGLLVANVPEGLLPTITLALAVGVRTLARRGAIVKRLSAIEVLGSTTVICTDKTGTLTENNMRATDVWTLDGSRQPVREVRGASGAVLGAAIAACSTVEQSGHGITSPDPTERALHELATSIGADASPQARDRRRQALFRFSSARRLMSSLQREDDGLWLVAKGAPESLTERCSEIQLTHSPIPFTAQLRDRVDAAVAEMAQEGLRVLAVGRRRLDAVPEGRDGVERNLTLLGLVGLVDPPRPEVKDAVEACHRAGIRVHVVTGDHGSTAAHVAGLVGIGGPAVTVVTGPELDAMPEDKLDTLLQSQGEVVFARSSPEAKLRIADALRASGEVVGMTGDGVNDAPALHRADIGIAMGRSGTDVAREAATMVLADDNFATIANAVEEGRRVYDNVRKFILYIFAHATPEIVPFLIFALAGGAVPLPLTVMQILAIDLGTETVPALALGREPAEPGIMSRPPRARSQRIVDRALLFRAWLFLGLISALLVVGVFFFTLWRGGWTPGAATGAGTPLHHLYLQATTATFVGIVACQIGTAFAARTDFASLRSVGVTSNRLLLWGVAFEVAFTALLIVTPGVQAVFGTATPPWPSLAVAAPFPLVVWGLDEWRRARRRRRGL